MKAASTAMITLLAQNENIWADCYTLTLLNGTVYYFTSFDIDLIVGGNVFVSSSLIFSRGNIKRARGLKVDVMTLEINAGSTNLMAGLPFLQFANNGGLDGARLLLQRACMPSTNPSDTSAGVLHGFEGTLVITELSRDTAKMEIHPDAELLNVMMPRLVYQPQCGNTLFDAGCTLVKATFQVSGSVSGTSSNPTMVPTGLSNPSGYFNGGTLKFTSGNNAGALCTVLAYVSGTFQLMRPLNAAVQVGDSVLACPGCPRSLSACGTVFSNTANFRGQPFVPTPETAA